MTTKAKTQVVIIGAGPTGLSLAAQLLRYQVAFIILDKNEGITPFSKAIAVQARTLEIFREINIAEKAIRMGRITTALNIFYKGKAKARLDLEGMGEGLSPFSFALSLEQCKTEQVLLDCLSEYKDCIYWKSEFTRLEQKDGVRAFYTDAHGMEQMIEADHLVGCDGAHSVVRHQLNATFEGDTNAKIFYIADVTLNSTVINKDELFIFLIKKGFILFFPMEGAGHYRVIGILPDKTEEDKFSFKDIEASIIEQLRVPVSFTELKWFSTYKVHSRKADTFRKDRCFIAGDAGHIHTPAGGQGMNTGIQDTYNLAWKLAYTIRYKMNDTLLESYNSERMENARHLLKTTDRMFDFLTGTGTFWNFIRLKIFPLIARLISRKPALNKRFFPLLSQIGISYPHSTLTIKSSIGKVEAGDRMPYFVVAGGRDIFEYINGPAWKLLFFGPDNHHPFDNLIGSKFPVITHSFKEIPGSIFNTEAGFYILLRPDNHISYIGKEISTCNMFLEKLNPG
ncbi:MAG TPA: FAD-dependent monooxygenase [Chitinophagaceae bacterium]|nr:FAD-dependent monooxygenase [Chitinophagaceae bacterium]